MEAAKAGLRRCRPYLDAMTTTQTLDLKMSVVISSNNSVRRDASDLQPLTAKGANISGITWSVASSGIGNDYSRIPDPEEVNRVLNSSATASTLPGNIATVIKAMAEAEKINLTGKTVRQVAEAYLWKIPKDHPAGKWVQQKLSELNQTWQQMSVAEKIIYAVAVTAASVATGTYPQLVQLLKGLGVDVRNMKIPLGPDVNLVIGVGQRNLGLNHTGVSVRVNQTQINVSVYDGGRIIAGVETGLGGVSWSTLDGPGLTLNVDKNIKVTVNPNKIEATGQWNF